MELFQTREQIEEFCMTFVSTISVLQLCFTGLATCGIRDVNHKAPFKEDENSECLVWSAEPQLAFCVAGRFLFSRCQRGPLGWNALRCGRGSVLVRVVYSGEHATATLLSQA